MRGLPVFLVLAAVIGPTALSDRAQAVCLDPKTLISGYKRELREEIDNTAIILVGEVTGERTLQEDPSDPTGITATLYSVHVVKTLKGKVLRNIRIRTENDSGRYPMVTRERHLLFLTKEDDHFRADSCGNSSPLPEAAAVLQQTEAILAKRVHAL
jgi:hypothetical protein